MNYLFAHHAEHNIYPVAPTYCAYEVDTVQVCFPLDLAALAVLTGGSVQELKDLNPTFKLGLVPDVQQPVSLYLPKDAVSIFIANEELLRYSFLATNPAAATTATPSVAETTSVEEKRHTVRRGESLGTIANKYGTSVAELKKLNHLRSNTIHPGQKLVVRRAAARSQERTASAEPGSSTETLYYTVQAGDTLWSIAQRHPGVSVEDLRRLNADLDRVGLQPGARIKLRSPQG